MHDANAPRPVSLGAIAVATLVLAFFAAAFAAWFAYGPDIYLKLIDGFLAWCM